MSSPTETVVSVSLASVFCATEGQAGCIYNCLYITTSQHSIAILYSWQIQEDGGVRRFSQIPKKKREIKMGIEAIVFQRNTF